MGEGMIAFDIEELHQVAAARAGVDAKGQIQFFRERVDWVKLRIVERQVAFHAAEKDAHRAPRLSPLHFRQRRRDIAQRQYHHPLEPIRRLGAGVGDKAVVGPALRDIQLSVVGKIDQKQGRVDNLDVDADLVHIL